MPPGLRDSADLPDDLRERLEQLRKQLEENLMPRIGQQFESMNQHLRQFGERLERLEGYHPHVTEDAPDDGVQDDGVEDAVGATSAQQI